MSKFYNIYDNISTDLSNFFDSLNLHMDKRNLKILVSTIISMIQAESVVTSKLATSFNSASSSSNSSSNEKTLWRFFNNKHIDIYDIFNAVSNRVISNISNVRHDLLIVTFDHMFIKNNFVILMFTLKIDNQGIPISFYLERTSSNTHSTIQKNSRKKLFSQDFIFNALDHVIDLLKPLNCKILFLADRWFFNLFLLKHIQDMGCFFAVRAKIKSSVKVSIYDKKEGHNISKNLSDLTSYAYKPHYFKDIPFGDMKFKANLAIAPYKKNKKDPDDEDNWFIITNLEPKLAIKYYKKRFGAIEMFSKAQKSNGFNLEKTKTKNLHAMETLYGVACIAHIWLSILGIDYIKNYNHVKHIINIPFNKKVNGKTTRMLSTFRLGLTLFKRLFNSIFKLRIKTNFKLYL